MVNENHRSEHVPGKQDATLSFDEIVKRNQKRVYYLALDLTGNHADAEDLAQDVFVKVYHSLDSFRGDAKVSSWLYRITVNTYIDRSRKKSWSAAKVSEDYVDEQRYSDSIHAPIAGTDPEESTASQLIQLHIDKALAGLSPQERTVFVLRHYNSCSLKEIATILGNQEGSVKSLLFRAIQKLRNSLAFYKKELGLEEKR